MIQIENLTFAYPAGDFRMSVPKLSVARGEAVALIGPSGSGKTTLLHLMAGILRPLGGTLRVDGTAPADLSPKQRRGDRISKIGLVFQEFELLDYLNVMENILLPYRLSPALKLSPEAIDTARALAESVGLADQCKRRPRSLSHGERQRVAICRALVTHPRMLLADEPTGNLDPKATATTVELIVRETRQRGMTLVMATHDHGLLSRFDRVIDMADFLAGEAG